MMMIATELDQDYVQRFQNIAIIAQLADSILAVAKATGKCVVPLDFDPDEYTSPDDCSCKPCTRKRKSVEASIIKESLNKEKEKEGETASAAAGFQAPGEVHADATGRTDEPQALAITIDAPQKAEAALVNGC